MPNLDLAIAARTRVHQGVVRAEKTLDSDKRWFWELLQNAKDTVARLHGQVDVKITFKLIEGKPILRFEHNGGVFNYSNHPYKYDDPKCLLLADTGKIEEDESQREDITGQFGTGFLSTHILSLKVLVEGVFFNRDENFYDFKFELDRNYNNPLELTPKIQNSLDQYDKSLTLTTQPTKNTFHTKFTYFLAENREADTAKGCEIVRNGISGIYNFIPYVMAFCKEVNSIEIIDEIDANKSVHFLRKSELLKIDNQVQVVSINRKTYDVVSGATNETSIEIALCSDLNTHVDVAIEIQKTELGPKILPIENELPVLFCTFPLIGSEKWRFPLMVNCTKFYPKTERDGIFLLTGNDNGNQSLIEKAVECYKHLLDFAINEKFQNLYWLAQTSFDICPTEWTSEAWYEGVLSTIRKFLLDKEIIVKENGEFILLKETLFPFHSGKEKLEHFWEICNEFIGASIPRKEDISTWNKIIDFNYPSWQANLIYDIERLLKDIQSHESLNQLATNKFAENENLAISWLNKVIYFVLFQAKKPDLLKTYKIVPNQLGKFSFIDEKIHFDNGISGKLKNLLDPFNEENWSFKKLLIAEGIEGFEGHLPFSTKDISDHINKLIKILIDQDYLKAEKDPNGTYKGFFYQLISFLPDNNFSERKHLYELSVELLLDDLIHEISIVKNLEEFDFSACNDWILKSLTEQVSKVDKGSLEGLQNINEKFKNKNQAAIINWLDDYIVFIANFENKKHKDLLKTFAIIPNQNEIFCPIDKLNKDEDIPFDLIKIAESSHIDHIWTNELLHNKLANTKLLFDEKSTIKIDDIATEINSAIRDYDGDKQNRNFAELVFLLNESETVNNSKHRKLFSDFHSKRDSLIVGTLGEGEALSNVAKLIQNPDKLAILAGLVSNENISKDQLEKLNTILNSESIPIDSIIDFAKNANGNLNYGLVQFEGFDIDFDDEKTDYRQIAFLLYKILKEGFIDPLKDSDLDYSEFRVLIEKYKNGVILEKSDAYNKAEVPDSFDKIGYEDKITAIAILKVISYLTTIGYEIIDDNSNLSTIVKAKKNGKELNIVIRPSNGQRYKLYQREKTVLSDKDSELWVSNGFEVRQETFFSLISRITGTRFIPLDDFVPGRLIG